MLSSIRPTRPNYGSYAVSKRVFINALSVRYTVFSLIERTLSSIRHSSWNPSQDVVSMHALVTGRASAVLLMTERLKPMAQTRANYNLFSRIFIFIK